MTYADIRVHQDVGLTIIERGQERNRIVVNQCAIVAAPSESLAVPCQLFAAHVQRIALATAARDPARHENLQALKQAHPANEVGVFQGQRQYLRRKNGFHDRSGFKFAIEISSARPLPSSDHLVGKAP